MADSEAIALDSVHTRRKLNTLSINIRRMSKKLKRIVADNLHELQDLDLLEVEKLELLTLKTEYKNNSAQLANMEEDAHLKEADEEAYQAMDENITAALMSCGLLLSWKRVQSAAQMLDNSVTSLNNLWTRDPDAQYSSLVTEMSRDCKTLQIMVETSRIDKGDPLRDQAREICARADGLRIKLGGTHTSEDKSSVKKGSHTSGYKRAPLQVPTFNGEMKEWHTFWTAFKLAIHNATDLDPEIKLSYLKEAMKDKTLQRTLSRFSEGSASYDLAVKELEARFDKPKLMHRLYLRNITGLSPVKAAQTDLTAFADTIQESLDGLKRLKQTNLEFILTSLSSEFLPDKLRLAWEDSTEACKPVAPIAEFLEFVRRKADNPLYMEESRGSGHQEKKPAHTVKARGSAHLANSSSVPPSAPPSSSTSAGQQHSGGGRNSSYKGRGSAQPIIRYSCPLCQELHYCFSCSSFRKMAVQQRKEYVSLHNLCKLCLKPNHNPDNCRGTFLCRVCEGAHNTLLHVDPGTQAQSVSVAGTSNVVVSDTSGSLVKNKLLMTCQVMATGPTGKAMPVRGLLDSGADISAVTTKVAKHLGLKKLTTTVTVSSYGDVVNNPASSSVSLVISAIHAKPWEATIDAVVIDKITGTIPRSRASSVREHPSLQGVNLADPHFDLPRRVDLLLGIDILPQILQGGVSSGTVGVWQTTLGHTVMGTYRDTPGSSSSSRPATVQLAVQAESPGHSPDGLALQRFWEVEQPSSEVAPFTREEVDIQEHYDSTHSFNVEQGKYQVVLPRNSKGLVLGESKPRAIKRFMANESALISKGNYDQFQAVVQEYLDLGHAQLLAPEDFEVPTPLTYYLPMHGVLKLAALPLS